MKPYYEHGGFTIYHGDCCEVMPNLSLNRFDFVLTDPPYGVDYCGGRKSAITHSKIKGDKSLAWLHGAWRHIYELQKDNTLALSFYGWAEVESFMLAWKRIGYRVLSHFAFLKNVWGFGYYTRCKHEVAYLLGKGKPPTPETAIADVVDYQRVQNPEHPTQKPIEALLPIMRCYTKPGDLVLDPFLGSGSTLVAAKYLGLAGAGIEIEERYCEIAAKRLSQGVLF